MDSVGIAWEVAEIVVVLYFGQGHCETDLSFFLDYTKGN